jgi:hypothetical protein
MDNYLEWTRSKKTSDEQVFYLHTHTHAYKFRDKQTNRQMYTNAMYARILSTMRQTYHDKAHIGVHNTYIHTIIHMYSLT